MADENTTDTQNSTTATTDADAASTSQSSSTTQTSDDSKPSADSTTDNGTILTGATDGDKKDEQQSDADKKDEQSGDADKGDKKDGEDDKSNALLGAPEGDYEITGLPEDVTVDAKALAALTPIAKEIGLSNEGMSKLAAVYQSEILPHVSQQIVSQMENDIAETGREWAAASRMMIEGGKDHEGKPVPADEAFGGKSYDEVIRASAKALDKFGTPELRQFLEETKMGNNPHMVRFAALAGMAISEDMTFDRGSGRGSTPKSDAEIFYGSGG
jgi:hypothetical protein